MKVISRNKENKNNNKAIIILLALVLIISIGFAYLSSALNITGSTKVSKETWEIYFANSELTNNNTLSPAAAPVIEEGTKPQEIGYEVTFNTPGEVYEFTVDVKNAGSLPAVIDDFTSSIKIGDGEETEIESNKSNLPTYLDYDITYANGDPILEDHEIAGKTSEKIKIRIEYKMNISLDELNESKNKTIYFNVKIDYNQTT